jgi:hypothetical protein
MVNGFFHVVDNFYPNPDKVRQKALDMPYTEAEDLVGWRTQAYHPRGIKRRIEKAFGVRIKYWEQDLTAIESCNGVFFGAWAKGKRAETVGVHYDEPVSWMMFLIYLTPGAPYDTGTSFWQHRKTGLIASPTRKDAERLGVSLEELLAILERDSQRPKCWREIDRIGNINNRAVIFTSVLLHCATRHFGSDHLNGRLYQSFHFPLC